MKKRSVFETKMRQSRVDRGRLWRLAKEKRGLKEGRIGAKEFVVWMRGDDDWGEVVSYRDW